MSQNKIKLILLGDAAVGKTSIVTQYVSGSVSDTVKPTIGAAFVTKDVAFEGKQIELLIWDTAGAEVYRGLAPMYYRSALIAFIVFDVTRQETFGAVSYWIRELKANVEYSIVLVVWGIKLIWKIKELLNFNLQIKPQLIVVLCMWKRAPLL
jgi:Rab family protein